MGASVLYSSTDVGAPVMNGKVLGSLMEVLYACLVTGYGNKSGLGSTSPFYDATSKTRVFRNNSVNGTGCFLRVQDDGWAVSRDPVPTLNFYALRMYSVMDTAHTGIDPIPSLTYNYGMRYTSYSDVIVKWRLIGDSRGFYLVTWPFGAGPWLNHSYVFYVGDLVSLFPDFKMYGLFSNLGNIATFASHVTLPVAYGTSISANNAYVNRDPVGKGYGSIEVLPSPCFPLMNSSRFGNSTIEVPLINGVPYSSDNLVEISGGVIIGKLPGLYTHLVRSGADTSTNPDINIYEEFFSSGGSTLLKLPLKGSGDAIPVSYPVMIQLRIGQGFR